MVWLQLLSAGMGLYGNMQAGQAARDAGREAQRQYQENAEMDKLRALQEKNARTSNFNAAMSTVDAQAGFANRSERSIAAVRKRSRSQLRQETDRSRTQSLFTRGREIQRGNNAMAEGKAKQRAYMIEGAASFANAYGRFKEVKGN
jgi:hypothetical protein